MIFCINKYVFRRYFLLSLGIFCQLTLVISQEYFQQEVNHTILVKLNDKKHELDGYESIEYINNSPDTLNFLYFHLWPNGYSDNNTELAKEIFRRDGKKKLFRDPELQGFIDSLDFKLAGNPAKWDLLKDFPDICRILLNEPLLPGDTLDITTPFHIKIPKGITSRLGHIGESYQISQWYPKPAVYDKTGWHQMPYMDEGEFFSEFGSFDVSITLPANYIVGATGNLQNAAEEEYLDSLAADSSWMKGPEWSIKGFPPSSYRLKTLRYTENNIHDFAWFADKRFHVMKGKVILPDSRREVTTWAMFTDQEAQLWKNSISYINKAIQYFSEWIGDYPYKSFIAVQSALNSGAGMEYPGITVIGLAKDPYFLDEVLAHEISHSWFYSAIGSNERRYPYMDESLASAYESRYMELRYPGKKYWEADLKNRKIARFFRIEDMPVQDTGACMDRTGRNNLEQPANLPSYDYSYDNYGNIIYNKAAQGFNYLRLYLGDSLFNSIMHDYYRSWKNRHPGPEDLRKVFESGTEKDLSWFFNDFLGTVKRLDYKVIRIEDQKLLIKNNGELQAPVLISGITGDSVVSEYRAEGFKGKKWINLGPNNYDEIKIDPGHKMTELYRLNNNIRTRGIFRRSDPFQVQFLYTIEDPDKRYLEYLPAFDWNRVDGFMIGAAIHNGTMIPKRIKYFMMPFYSFHKNGITGYGNISLNITPYNYFIRLATFTLEGSQFGAPGNQNYHKIKIGIDLTLKSDLFDKSIKQNLFGYYYAASDLNQIEALEPAAILSYMQCGYLIERFGIINPYKIAVSLESGKAYIKTSLEINYRHSYTGKNSGLDIRIFSGIMLRNNSSDPIDAFSAGARSGPELYLYQGVYPDRFSRFPANFWSRQMTFSEEAL
ncbi:MAG: M1 family metallopeptidase [Bacteroidales bacterium]|nr:M1 family metallopeptidase [Bacteroidales bacterium]